MDDPLTAKRFKNTTCKEYLKALFKILTVAPGLTEVFVTSSHFYLVFVDESAANKKINDEKPF